MGFHISVNMSYIQLQEPSIVADVNEALWKSGLPGSALSLEITESIHLQNFHYYNNIFHQWRDNGIRISVDDLPRYTGHMNVEVTKDTTIFWMSFLSDGDSTERKWINIRINDLSEDTVKYIRNSILDF